MNQLEFEFLWPHRAIQLSLDLDEMNNNEREKYMNQAEYDAERTANGDKRLIDLLYQKIELQQAEIEALKVGKIKAYDNGYEDGRKSNTNPMRELTDEEIKKANEK